MRAIIFIMLALQVSKAIAAEGHGISRLFTTQVERERLDSVRKLASVAAMQAQEVKANANAEDVESGDFLPEKISMQGFVKRSDGKKSTLWINHYAIQEGASKGDIQVGSFNKNERQINNTIHFKLKKSDQVFDLKPGQDYLPSQSRVVDLSGLAQGRSK